MKLIFNGPMATFRFQKLAGCHIFPPFQPANVRTAITCPAFIPPMALAVADGTTGRREIC